MPEKAGVVVPRSVEGLDDVFKRFEHFAVRAKWSPEGKGIFTLDNLAGGDAESPAEAVKSVSRELRKALADAKQIEPSEDQPGAIVRAEGPCAIYMKDDTHVITIAVHGGGELPIVAGVNLHERTIVHIPCGDVSVPPETIAYLLLLGKGMRQLAA